MIQKTVYFQTQEDANLFNALSNKAQWLHDKLNDRHAEAAERGDRARAKIHDGYVNVVPEKAKWPGTIVLPGQTTIDEALDPEKPCCKQPKPCMHWQWNGNDQVYINTLSYRVRET